MTPTSRGTAPFQGNAQAEGLPPNFARSVKDGRGGASVAASFATAKPAQSLTRPAPGSFGTELKSALSRNDGGYYGSSYATGLGDSDEINTTEQRQAGFRDQIEKEMKIRIGSENLLEALNAKNAKQTRDQRKLVESELNTSNRKITQLQHDLQVEIQKSKEQPLSPKGRLSQLFRNAPLRSPSWQSGPLEQDAANPHPQNEPEQESPTYILAEILQAFETQGMASDYYVNHANELVDLFKRHPTLKYDLAWSIFGLKAQMLLLSDSREVVAAGYRVLRFSITDRKSLQTIRELHTDYLVILSLIKDAKARVEREQALKFVRAFLDVKDGVREIHPAVARIVVAVADHNEDQLRNIAILTLSELMLKDPQLLIEAGGAAVLSEAMGDGTYPAPETLVGPLLHLMDLPSRRKMLRTGFEFSSAFAAFTEPPISHSYEDKLKMSARVVASLFKTWSGLMVLSSHDFLPVRSIVSSLYINTAPVRTATLDLVVDILRIKQPSWSSSFIGGRRLTTYGRVTNLKTHATVGHDTEVDDEQEGRHKRSLVQHFTSIVLALLLRHGLLRGLMHAENDAPTLALKRRTSLLTAEILKMSSDLLPHHWSTEIQSLPLLFQQATSFNSESRFDAVATVYQVDSVNRTLYRSTPGSQGSYAVKPTDDSVSRTRALSKSQFTNSMDETQFRQSLIDSNVLNTVNYIKWKWDLIHNLIEGPLLNPKRLHEAMNTKFVHRLLGFLRPFKFRFSDAANTKPNQRYVRTGCALVKTLLQTNEGARYLAENKLVRQIAECLAQFDPASGITSATPLFSPERLSETLVGGYFAILGVLCSDGKGLLMLERWKVINMFYHIVELRDRDDLIRALLTSLDYSLDSHPRIILSKAMTAGSKQMRIAATRILRKHAILPIDAKSPTGGGTSEWAIKLLVSQLYDPEIEVCEVAIKILEEACNAISSLEFVVKCRPALDHLGEIGAPLLLRFLSTSVGYHYLDGLDYITKEMDDWFLGRNDSYVALVEVSLARALADVSEKPQPLSDPDALEPHSYGSVPPHFYRELTRTAEGCELLRAKGHFEEFANTIQDLAMEDQDAEIILKVKGCLWAVGNVGSMELGAPFLERTDVTKHVLRIAEQSQVMTLRGTAFFVLGLISRSLHGQEILAEYGWDGTVNMLGESLGYSLPLNFLKLFALEQHESASNPPGSGEQQVPHRPTISRSRASSKAAQDGDPVNRAILDAIIKLGNTVLMNKAIMELNSLKHHRKAPGFQKPGIFRKAMVLLASHQYRVPQYRFVIDLFDKQVLRKIVLDDDYEEEEDDDVIDGDVVHEPDQAGGSDESNDEDDDEDENDVNSPDG
ncbi:hypothetical protein K431DRAFT_283312 [Polychaeton citri CBS 116435]|uniref:REM-1 domain-containing protein n=1 Tax=Polychaeton citri CBS 116435 TaxID=1314669 RepID=A0A9P4USJ6_9PEZI|nr:hypothetical protein K431DRAFT_283312 [Polychaeton citri CBS 116435]